VAVLGLKHLESEAHQAIMKDTSEFPSYSIEEFEEDQLAAAENPRGQWFLDQQARPTAIDTIQEVSSWHGYSEEYLRKLESELAEEEKFPALWNEPDIAFNPYRDVGRNDPCPCGSGKKYKKCCLN
jgi:preprotein translocase subunit SecA